MKRLYTLISILAVGNGLFAQQVILTYKTHGLSADHVNEMKMIDYVDPGASGKNQVWDLSSMKSSKELRGFVAPASEADTEFRFSEANMVLNEDGQQFFFCQEEDVLTAWGSMTKTGQVRMKYHHPFIKMKYPFTYGDEFSGNYEGTYYLTAKDVPLAGTYSVKADGHGKLILPGGKEVNNTLRVVSARSYDLMMENGAQTYEILTYRWYSNGERFPLAVLLMTRSAVCNPEGNYNYRAFYRLPEQSEELSKSKSEAEQDLAMSSIPETVQNLVRIFPNPVVDQFTMEYTVNAGSKVFIELYNNTGNKIATLVDQYKVAGSYSESFSAKKYALTHGIYHIRGLIGDHSSNTSFIRE